MNRSNIHGNGGFGPQGFGGNFYNQQVYKPIRGGGGAKNDRPNTALNFSENQGYKTSIKSNDNRTNDPNMKDNRFRSENRGIVSKKD